MLLLAACLGCDRSAPPKLHLPSYQVGQPKLRDIMSKAGTAILNGATRVEVFRVAPEKAQKPAKGAIEGYPILAKGKDQDKAFAAKLRAILLGDGVTQNAKKCGLQPGVAFRLWSGDKAVDLLVCFNCDVLWPHVMGDNADAPWHEWQDFDAVRADLAALARQALPDDQEIQKLAE